MQASPRVGCSNPARMLSSVVLPQTARADDGKEFVIRHVEVHVVKGKQRLTLRRYVHLADMSDVDLGHFRKSPSGPTPPDAMAWQSASAGASHNQVLAPARQSGPCPARCSRCGKLSERC